MMFTNIKSSIRARSFWGAMAAALAVSALMMFTVVGCSQHVVFLKKSPSNRLLESIENMGSIRASFAFKSELPDPFRFGNIDIDLNSSFESNLKYYINEKFTLVDAPGDYHIEILLKACSAGVVNAGREVARVSGSTVGTRGTSTTSGTVVIHNITVSTEMKANVRLIANGVQVAERDFMSLGEYTGNHADPATSQMSFNLAIDRTLLSIDRFLNNAINNAVAPSESPVTDSESTEL